MCPRLSMRAKEILSSFMGEAFEDQYVTYYRTLIVRPKSKKICKIEGCENKGILHITQFFSTKRFTTTYCKECFVSKMNKNFQNLMSQLLGEVNG